MAAAADGTSSTSPRGAAAEEAAPPPSPEKAAGSTSPKTQAASSPRPVVQTKQSSILQPQKGSRAVGPSPVVDANGEDLRLGARVRVRDHEDQNWQTGTVTGLRPLKVQVDGWDEGFMWGTVEKVEHQSPASKTPADVAAEPQGRIFNLVASSRVQILQRHRSLRESLMAAIVKDDPAEIESLLNRGASLQEHYYSKRLEAQVDAKTMNFVGNFTAKGAKSGLVNPVDWAVLERRPRAALQILTLADGRLVFDRDEEQSHLVKIDIARQSRRAVNQCAFYGYQDLLWELLKRGAFVGQKNGAGESPLLVAVRGGRELTALLLLEHGAWPVEEHPRAVLQLAACHSMRRVLEVLVVQLQAVLPLPPFTMGAMPKPPEARTTQAWDRLVQELAIAQTAEERRLRLDLLMETARGQEPKSSIAELDHGWSRPTTAASNPEKVPSSWGADEPLLPWVAAACSSVVNAEKLAIQDAVDSRSSGGCTQQLAAIEDGSAAADAAPAPPLPAAPEQAQVIAQAGWTHERLANEVDKKSLNRLRGAFAGAIRRAEVTNFSKLMKEGSLLHVEFDLGFGGLGTCLDWAIVKDHPVEALQLIGAADEVKLGSYFAKISGAGFFWAVVQGYTEVLAAMLERGADVMQTHEVWSKGDRALELAVFGSRIKEIEVLLKYDAWEKEAEDRRDQLLRWARSRPTVAEAFRKNGIIKDKLPIPSYVRDTGFELTKIVKPDPPPAPEPTSAVPAT
eukprot:TRINITY_DN11467_c0_g1_i1.p1 TRINITY_DN11467_c0_g1~~TRINITY_DN11467_c0_g1_i1.p1  ORF type:complete len:737 (+),score=211.28 TRINITY_DN11467_c0_g1_i1:93-2303(+)